jgi:DNA mismatch repair ATPase MutL
MLSTITYNGDGITRVFPVAFEIKGEDYVVIYINNVAVNDRTLYDIINNSIVFSVGSEPPIGSNNVQIVVATSPSEIADLNAPPSTIQVVIDNLTGLTDIVSTVIPNLPEILLADDNATIATTKAGEALTSANKAFSSEKNAELAESKATAQAGIATVQAGIAITNGSVAVDSTIATKTYADNAATTAVANVIDTAPEALNTLNELAAALNDDANFSTTITTSIGTKLNSSAVSAFGLTLVDDADAATARATLGLATVATSGSYADLSNKPAAGVTTGKAIAMAIVFGG